MEKLAINKRRIIPLRAIPEVTGRRIPPDELIKTLAGIAPRWRPKVELQAYHLDRNGKYYAIPKRDWDTVVRDLSTLDRKLYRAEQVEDENHPLWRETAAATIPKSSFAWWDEFEEFVEQLFPSHMEELIEAARRRPHLGGINENPMISDKLLLLIQEGFGQLMAEAPTKLPSKRDRRKAALSDRNDLLRLEARKLQRSKKHRDKSKSWIAKYLANDPETNVGDLKAETIRQIIR